MLGITPNTIYNKDVLYRVFDNTNFGIFSAAAPQLVCPFVCGSTRLLAPGVVVHPPGPNTICQSLVLTALSFAFGKDNLISRARVCVCVC